MADPAGRPVPSLVRVHPDDFRAAPLLAGLATEYSTAFGWEFNATHDHLLASPAGTFSPPHGAMLLVVENEDTVAGGAFHRRDPATATLKRVWTAPAHRRQGLACRVVDALEDEIRRLGFTRVHLNTAATQTAAIMFYEAKGYTPLPAFLKPDGRWMRPFEKLI